MSTWKRWLGFGGFTLPLMAVMCGQITPVARAQSAGAGVVGAITDASGAAVAQAAVKVTNVETGQSFETHAGADGTYTVPSVLNPGSYEVEASKEGFKTTTSEGFTLQVGDVKTVNLTLSLGQVSEKVTVTAAAPLLEAQTSDVGQVVSTNVVQLAPLNARNFTQLATLVPGVVRGAAGSPLAGGGGLVGSGGLPAVGTEGFRFQTSGGSDIVISGLRPENNNFQLDGVDNNEPVFQQVGIFTPPDAIQEFKIITATPSAQYGAAAGGVISVISRSGTNQFHASGYEFFRNSALDARNFFDPAPNPKFALHRNEFGGTVGGPIRRDKTFFFFDYNGFRNFYPASIQAVTVPTPKVRSGDFSEYGVTVCDPKNSTSTICNPTNASSPGTFLAETGANVIPTADQDPAALNLLNAFPDPNTTGIDNGTRNNYLANRERRESSFHTDIRIDHALRSNDTLTGRLTWDNLRRTTPSLFPKVPAGFGTGRESSLSRGVVASETHIFGANLVNEFHFGFLKTGVQIHEPGVDGELGIPVNYGEQLGIPNSNPAPAAGGLPLIVAFDGLFSDGGFVGDGGTFEVPSDTYQFNDAISIHHGRHDLKTGVSIIRRIASDAVGNTAKGQFFYGGTSGGTTTGDSLSDLLLGVNELPSGFGQPFGRGPLVNADERWWETGYFVQDDWKVDSQLTLNIGLRYDLFTNITEKNNRLGDFDPSTGHIRVAGGSLINTDLNNFGPRLGFAYQVDPNTVVRGGGTVMYTFESPGFNGATPNLVFNPPFTGFDAGPAVPDPNGFGNDFALSQGLAPFTPSINPNAPTGAVIFEDPNKRTPYIASWNVGVEHQLGSWLFSLAGVGNSGHKLGALRPLTPTSTDTVSSITAWEGRANSSYNSLQVRVEKRLSHGLSTLSSYTWSHCITDSEGIVSSGGFGGNNFPEDTNRLYLEKGNCENDIRHTLSQAYQWDLPFGRGKRWGQDWSGAANQVLSGWSFSGINLFRTGDHLTPTQGGPVRLNLVAGQDPNNGPQTVQEWFNTAAFTHAISPTPILTSGFSGVFPDGTAGRGIIVGPGQVNFDLSAIKNFSLASLREGSTAQLRFSFYNIFNHTQLADPNPGNGNAVQGGSFGVIDHAYEQRQIEIAIKLFF